MLSGDNGILQKATDARTNTDRAEIQEQINLAYHSALVDGQGEVTKSSLEKELKKEFDKTTLDEGWLDKTSTAGKWKITINGVFLDVPAGNDEASFTFYVCIADVNEPFEAKEGMTFRQWITAYSPEHFSEYESGTYVQYQSDRYRHLLTAPDNDYPSVNMDDEIIKDAVYGLYNIDD